VESGEHLFQTGVEAVEHIGWQAGEQLPGELAVAVGERLGGGVPACGEGDQRRAAIGGMRLAGHESGGHQAVDQRGDRAGRDVQGGGKRALGARSALLQPGSGATRSGRRRMAHPGAPTLMAWLSMHTLPPMSATS
jgi:hypothetical protein